MLESPTAGALYKALCDKLQLQWHAGEKGTERPLTFPLKGNVAADIVGCNSFVGYLNLIRPNQIQVLGVTELEFLSGLGKNSSADAISNLFINAPVCIIVCDGQPVPEVLLQGAQRHTTALFASTLRAEAVVEYLRYYLAARNAQRGTLHGVFMEIMGIGVLISGSSGIGKSELALELITRGHRLIADDAPEFHQHTHDSIIGSCPEPLRDFLEVRGLGMLDVRAMFGDNAIKTEEILRLVISLKKMSDGEVVQLDRIQGERQLRQVFDIDVPEITMPVIMGSNMAVLVEGAVRNHLLLLRGYTASDKFIERQRRIIAQDK
ncbi:HPr kinase/phosphorylase [hydrothermal vent metagenome]|uniref:HPr kinase/phosphorylase n=1 Tax=hydrothermal vent metagenome TaxID=652676 RepID=A0A3B0Z8T7_9ZZZZ